MAALERPVVKPRPVYLNLLEIRQPLAAVISIMHRASGALMFLIGIPMLLWALSASVASADTFARWKGAVGSVPGKLLLLVLAWAYLHHLLAGLRHLLLDLQVGGDLPAAKRSATIVFALALLLTLIVAVRLW